MGTWEQALADEGLSRWHGGLRESEQQLATGRWDWFDRAIPSAERWRAYGDLAGQALYLDIETDGGTSGGAITVIGAFDGRDYRAFVAGENLDQAQALIEAHPLVITFNGSLFDLPIIRDRFRYNFFNHVHVDLRFTLRRLGLRGGLKAIEQALGLARSDATQGLDGWDAVRLWREYLRGSAEALEVLLAYNREDVVNLHPLMQRAFGELAKGIPS